MPRAAYNQLMNVYTSAGLWTPDILRFTTPCRVVFTLATDYDDFPFSVIIGYATHTSISVSAGNWEGADNGVTLNLFFNDVLEFSDNPGFYFQAFFTQEIIPADGQIYRRVSFF